jgi:AcrR family transcriptional regulator
MSKKKLLILNTARTLFNEKGYFNVTIRMIALELNMSSGNLNYHFKKREDIFEALYFEMVSVVDQRIKDLPTVEISIAHIRKDIEQSMQRMITYKFFWTDLYQLLNVSTSVKTHFQDIYISRKNAYTLLFKLMIQDELIKEPTYSKEYDFLAERMLNYGNTWLYETNLYPGAFDENNIELQVNSLLSMLFPYLTIKGKKDYKEVLPSYF